MASSFLALNNIALGDGMMLAKLFSFSFCVIILRFFLFHCVAKTSVDCRGIPDLFCFMDSVQSLIFAGGTWKLGSPMSPFILCNPFYFQIKIKVDLSRNGVTLHGEKKTLG